MAKRKTAKLKLRNLGTPWSSGSVLEENEVLLLAQRAIPLTWVIDLERDGNCWLSLVSDVGVYKCGKTCKLYLLPKKGTAMKNEEAFQEWPSKEPWGVRKSQKKKTHKQQKEEEPSSFSNSAVSFQNALFSETNEASWQSKYIVCWIPVAALQNRVQ